MRKTIFLIVCIALFSTGEFLSQSINSITRDNVLKIPMTTRVPKINGADDDDCWKLTKWQPIDQVWMPYGAEMSKEDFSGKYKVVWSEYENLLYFVVKTTDDVFVDGYIYNSDPTATDHYYDYDLLEVFIDEDQSGGIHIFDNENSNAENAFAYHISLFAPDEGKTTSKFVACDIAGNDWENHFIPDYGSHFRNFVMKKNGDEYTWEFSLRVYNDKYEKEEPENYRVQLTENKEIGLSLAYCDNDGRDESPKVRDNFIGSVYVDEKSFNDHWQNCSGFRKAILVK